MLTINGVLNRIKHDPRIDKNQVVIKYKDRFKEELQELEYLDVVEIQDGIMHIVLDTGKIVTIPTHRIREISHADRILLTR